MQIFTMIFYGVMKIISIILIMYCPQISFFTKIITIFLKTAGFDSNLTLTDTNDSSKIPLNIDEIFNNGLTNRKDYIHFAPNLNTPRELFTRILILVNPPRTQAKFSLKRKLTLSLSCLSLWQMKKC